MILLLCLECDIRFRFDVDDLDDGDEPSCPECGSTDLEPAY